MHVHLDSIRPLVRPQVSRVVHRTQVFNPLGMCSFMKQEMFGVNMLSFKLFH